MRVALLHNPTAGGEDHDDAKLAELVTRNGHELVHLVQRVSDLTAALHRASCDLVVVAGGDGTVGRAACELAGWQVPLSIFALGTANNTARSLNLPAAHKHVARNWNGAERVAFDLGVFGDGTVRRRFAEAVGWGVFASVVATAKERGDQKSVRKTLKRDRKLFQTTSAAAIAQNYTIEIDGRDVSGEYLLVEVMNVPLLGPRLRVSPLSDASDGVFELVLASSEHRGSLDELARTGELAEPLALRVERGKQIRIQTSEPIVHVDGRLWRRAPGINNFDISVETSAIHYLR
jgi:diacylglycerol kinase family enzyme